MRRLLRLLTVASVLAVLLAAAAPASAYQEWNHSTALGKRSCAVGCHAEQTPTNATCTGCHAGFKTRGTQKCWSCHEPGADTSAWQLAAGCTTTCHLLTSTDDEPAYTTSYAHTRSAHLGASGYGKTCVDCHGVSSGATAPGASPHHDAVDSPAPACATCHNGTLAAAKTSHAGAATSCAACHTGHDRPAVPASCLTCHSSVSHPEARQIAFTNDVSCTNARCHGTTALHTATPALTKTCSTCHTAHYQALGGCQTCHPNPQTFHHGTTTARPLADCAGCHDGGIAAAPAGHGAYGANCASCHSGMDRPSGDCSSCHVGRTGTTTPQITYTNTLACADAGCHGKVVNHGATPISAAPCSTCHTAHYQALGGCQTCHPDPQTFHHGTTTARPLADCAGCHDGGIAAAKASHLTFLCSVCHDGMERPSVPAACSRCHFATKFGSATCTSCHSSTGMMGREQVHDATPGAGISCATCHDEHYADLGACQTCHGRVPEAHHGVSAPASSVLGAQASPARLAAGAAAVVSGTLRDAGGAPLAGAQVLLQARRFSATGFSDLATLTTSTDGGFSQPVEPVAGTEYRVVYRGGSSPATVLRPAIARATIAVRQVVRLSARPTRAQAGARVRFAGTVAPSARQLDADASAVTLRVERSTASGWRKVAGRTVTPRADGTYSWSWRPRTAGSYRVRATVAATPELLAGVSARARIRVR